MKSVYVSYIFDDKKESDTAQLNSKNVPPIQSINDIEALNEQVRNHFKFKKVSILHWQRFEAPESKASEVAK